MAKFNHVFSNDEWSLDGAIISADVRLQFDYAYDRDGPFFVRFAGATFADGKQVRGWLHLALTQWCRVPTNEDLLNDKLARETSRTDDYAA